MSFFNLPDIFHIGDTFRQGYESRYERKIGKDSRNIALLEPLETTLTNLESIRERIGTRISKEIASGTDMTSVVEALDSADRSLDAARRAVETATSTLDAPRPRPPYMESQAAYVALGQARESLDIVLDEIITAADQASTTPRQITNAKKRN